MAGVLRTTIPVREANTLDSVPLLPVSLDEGASSTARNLCPWLTTAEAQDPGGVVEREVFGQDGRRVPRALGTTAITNRKEPASIRA